MKQWCCEHSGKGCPDPALAKNIVRQEGSHYAQARDIDMQEGPDLGQGGNTDLQAIPSAADRPHAGAPSNGGFDCVEGFLNRHLEWTQGRKQWCCAHRRIGCEYTKDSRGMLVQVRPAEKTYDCQAGVLFWKQRWSYDQKDWCCQRHHVGCYDCSGEATMWPAEQQEWCCKARDDGCHLDHPWSGSGSVNGAWHGAAMILSVTGLVLAMIAIACLCRKKMVGAFPEELLGLLERTSLSQELTLEKPVRKTGLVPLPTLAHATPSGRRRMSSRECSLVIEDGTERHALANRASSNVEVNTPRGKYSFHGAEEKVCSSSTSFAIPHEP